MDWPEQEVVARPKPSSPTAVTIVTRYAFMVLVVLFLVSITPTELERSLLRVGLMKSLASLAGVDLSGGMVVNGGVSIGASMEKNRLSRTAV